MFNKISRHSIKIIWHCPVIYEVKAFMRYITRIHEVAVYTYVSVDVP